MRTSRDELSFRIIGFVFLSAVAAACLLPFILIVSASLTEETAIFKNGYGLVPSVFSAEAYAILLKVPGEILQAFGVTILVVIVGTAGSLFLTALAAYALSNRQFKYRNRFSLFIYITSIFSGGLIPLYILMVGVLHLKNTLPALILPLFMNAWNIFLLKKFMSEIPVSIMESAKIDGAGEFAIFFKMIVPLSVQALVTIGLFQALYYWNDWMQAMLYITDKSLFPIQYYLYNMLNSFQSINSAVLNTGLLIPRIPTESIKMAVTVISIAPVIALFPFVQRYYIKGLTVGSIVG